jgi:hypothetical protein
MQPQSPPRSPSEIRALLHEKLDALLDECDQVGDNAAYGQYLDDTEEFFLTKGRQFLQETFQEKVQERIRRTEADAETKQCAACKKNVLPRHAIEKHSLCSRTHHDFP